MLALTMLGRRVMTSLLLAPLAILAILKLPVTGFAAVWGVVLLIGAWEWAALSGIDAQRGRVGLVVALLASMLAAWTGLAASMKLILDLAIWPLAVFWLTAGFLLRSRAERLMQMRPPWWLLALVGVLLLWADWAYLVELRVNYTARQPVVLYLFFLVWIADTGAYFVGSLWGSRPLSPISPKKTNEGLLGALAAAALFALAYGLYFNLDGQRLADWVLLSVVTVLFSVSSDLLESLLKRWQGAKDSGWLLPGHGGLLDRIDGFIAAIPVFYVGLLLQPGLVL